MLDAEVLCTPNPVSYIREFVGSLCRDGAATHS